MATVSNRGLNLAVNKAMSGAIVEMTRLVANAMNSGSKGIANGLEAYLTAVDKELVNTTRLREIHTVIAQQATARVVSAFKASTKTGSGLYASAPNRLGGGKLLAALQEFTATPTDTGIEYINAVGLNSAAAFWQRLNFGAGSRGAGRTPTIFPMSFAGVQIGRLGLRAGPRPGFDIPAGRWFPGGQFFVGSSQGGSKFLRAGSTYQRRKPTQGIAGREFFDAGLAYIAAELPAAYVSYLNRAIEDGKTALAASLAGFTGGQPF